MCARLQVWLRKSGVSSVSMINGSTWLSSNVAERVLENVDFQQGLPESSSVNLKFFTGAF